MSQLGLIVVAVGGSGYSLALFHLFCHSFFKALLFISAGAIIHSVISESQDMRTYGGFNRYLPFTYTCLLIASLSLMAIPGLTGFYSKDAIIESILAVCSIFVGYLFRDLLVGFGTDVVFQLPHTFSLVETEFTLTPVFKLLPITCGVTISIITVYSYEVLGAAFKSNNYRSVFSLFNQRLMYDQMLNHLVIRKGLLLGGNLNNAVDQGVLQ
ncbi:hypothetical protein BABINDRAFT_169589 [Babjeviella inositovora NRRL Y-12698]|uniref:NADH:quinone oxidoreductase/Mrp antiporter transmembrane domain-containing protein n=1 Tax=Babjeviella inositovora NRRL Y-12698 TaxID=984486 RepID=A0A1E3QGS7_9ASCO|nr:uncharacterized protein BABINDRAFT_169589 [Babjeviella inositovora NRRL Y-12698]ODQ76905.1 hypothetical protein BABINDRAFT_169589 [Babjeviella inositovora NRRL Y-12698]